MKPVPKPAHDRAPSHEGLPFAKPDRTKRIKKGGITQRKERVEATNEKRFGPHAELIEACPCAVQYPEFYVSRESVRITLLTAAKEITTAKALSKAPPKRSAAHHALRRGQGGLARHVVPINRWTHDESHLHGSPNAYLAEKGLKDARALADLLWSVKEEIRRELEAIERGGVL